MTGFLRSFDALAGSWLRNAVAWSYGASSDLSVGSSWGRGHADLGDTSWAWLSGVCRTGLALDRETCGNPNL